MHSMPFSFVGKRKLERSLTLNSISLFFFLVFSRFLLWEELGGPEKDLFVFWLVLKKTGFFFFFLFFFCFFFFFFCLEIVSPFTLRPFTAKTLQAFQSTRWHQNWT